MNQNTHHPRQTGAPSRATAGLLLTTAAIASGSSALSPAGASFGAEGLFDAGQREKLTTAQRRAAARSPQEQARVDVHNTLKAAREAGRYNPQDLDAQMAALRGVTKVRVDTRYRQLLRRESNCGLDAAAQREFDEVSRLIRMGHGGQYLSIPAERMVGKAAQRRLQAERSLTLGEVYRGNAPATAWANAPCRMCAKPNGIPNPACDGHSTNGKVIRRRRGTVIRLVALGV